MTAAPGRDALASLTRLPGVRGAALVVVEDGLVVRGHGHVGVDLDAVAALGASLARRSRAACLDIGRGAPRTIAIDALGGRLHIAIAGTLAVVVVAGVDAHPGMIRVTAQRALDDLAVSAGQA